MLTTESPRFNFRAADFAAIEETVATMGHVVLDGVWNPHYLAGLRGIAAATFDAQDVAMRGDRRQMADSTIEGYYSAFIGLENLGGDWVDLNRAFYEEIERTGLTALYRRFMGGDPAIFRSERVVRRVDPSFPLRFCGLHRDGQLRFCSERGLLSKRELTLWTPLQPCVGEEISRLLLLHRGESYRDLFTRDDKIDIAGVSLLPLELRISQIRNEAERMAELAPKIAAAYAKLFANRRCYAPHVPLGAAVLFDRDIEHGSYCPDGATKPRFSLDFRVTGEFTVDDVNRPYTGRLFRAVEFP